MEPKQIIVRPATPEDAPIIAATLTMALGKETMKLYCGENYQDVLEELVRMENTQYSYRNALVADVNGTPAGAIVGYDGARLHELRRPTLRRIEERTGQTFEGVEDETHPGEYYLDSLGVLPEYRRLGIGGRLLTALRDKAFAEGHERAGLLVDVENPGAEHLYHTLGFERVETRSLFGHKLWHLQALNRQETSVRLDHAALYVRDLEGVRTFFTHYFQATSNDLYHNPRTGLKTYFLTFGNGTRLEIMTRPDLQDDAKHALRTGFIHISFSVGSKERVDQLTAQLRADGYAVLDGPRTTGDGYYESCVEGPEGNLLEITA